MNPAPCNRPLGYALFAAGLFSAVEIGLAMWDSCCAATPGFGFFFMILLGPVLVAGLMLLVAYRAEVRRDPGTVIAGVLAGLFITYLFTIFPYDILTLMKGRPPASGGHMPYLLFPYTTIGWLGRGYLWKWMEWLRDCMRPALLPLFPLPVPPYVAPPSAHGTRPVDPPIAKPTNLN